MINFINVTNSDIFFNDKNNIITIQLYDAYNQILYSSKYYIRYDLINNMVKKKYFIEVNNIDVTSLKTENFKFPETDILYKYAFYNGETIKSIVVYNTNNYFQFIYYGLPNLKNKNVNIVVNYEYNSIESQVGLVPIDLSISDSQTLTLLNNYQGTLNYLQNSLFLEGTIYEIEINLTNGIVDATNSIDNNYKLYKINNKINLDYGAFIYFYNDIKNFSYILYLNTYNFSIPKLYPENYEILILMIDYINSEDSKKYSIILSLCLQTFNSVQNNNGLEYYDVLFFKNYVNDNYIVEKITMFDYDYEKYFANSIQPQEYHNINSYDIDLYIKIIEIDTNLKIPLIPNINYSYLLINFDLLNLINLIKYDCENKYFINFLKSNKISVDTLVNYLSNFEFKLYNVYSIININEQKYKDDLLSYKENFTYIYNYLYTNNNIVNKNDILEKGIINFNNNLVNSLKCKIIFLFNYMGEYSVYGKLFLDNYNIQIYHKKYDIDTLEKKKKLVNLLLYLATVSMGIKIIFYNNLDSEPKVSSFYNYYLNTNPFYLFNEINLSKNLKNYNTFLNISSTNNNYDKQFLKFNINMSLNYYILFLYSSKESILNNYSELVFSYSQYIFKIFKNNDINGNTFEDKDLFYIVFNDLKDINIFMEYLNSGLFILNNNKLSNYFNVTKSVIFCNYYNINNYWVLDSLPGPENTGDPNVLLKNKIYFSINNLKIDQIYLYGDFFINELL